MPAPTVPPAPSRPRSHPDRRPIHLGLIALAVHLPPGVPVRTRLAGGAGSATIDGATRTGLSGGTELPGGDASTGTGGYDPDVVGGLSALRVDRY